MIKIGFPVYYLIAGVHQKPDFIMLANSGGYLPSHF